MTVIERLNKIVELSETEEQTTSVSQFVDYLKPILRKKINNNFLKIHFDNDDKQGVVFVKYCRCPYKDVTNECIEKSPIRFIISVGGFNNDGTIDENSVFDVDMYNYKTNGKIRRMRNKRCYNINEVKSCLLGYFNRNINELSEDGGGIVGTGSSGTSTADVAVFKQRLGIGDTRRPLKKRPKI